MPFLNPPPPPHLLNEGMLDVSFFPFVTFSCCKQNLAMVIKNSPASIKGRLPLKRLVLCLLYHRCTRSHCWNRPCRSKVCNRPKERCDQSVYFPPSNDRPIINTSCVVCTNKLWITVLLQDFWKGAPTPQGRVPGDGGRGAGAHYHVPKVSLWAY